MKMSQLHLSVRSTVTKWSLYVTHLNMVCTTVFRLLPTANVTYSFNLKVTASNLLQGPHIFSSSVFNFYLIYRLDLSFSLSHTFIFLHYTESKPEL